MKKKMKQVERIFCICYLTVMISAPFYNCLAGVRDDMGGIPDLDSLQTFYEENNNYVRRYVLRELPDWLKTRGLPPDIPYWVHDALEDALNTYRPLLIMEASILTGHYGIAEFSDRMAEIYKAAHRWFPADADRVRCAIIQAILDIGGVSAETYIPELFLYSHRYLLSNEFTLLVTAVGQYGDSLCLEEVIKIEQEVKNILAEMSSESDPSRITEKYRRILLLVSSVKEDLLEKGVGNE